MDPITKNWTLLKAVFQALKPDSFLEISSAPPDAYRVRMKDGRLLLAWLDQDGKLQLREIEEVW